MEQGHTLLRGERGAPSNSVRRLVIALPWLVAVLLSVVPLSHILTQLYPGSPRSPETHHVGWLLVVSGNALLLSLAMGLHRWARCHRVGAPSWPGQVLGNTLAAALVTSVVGLVCLGGLANTGLMMLLLFGLPVGGVLLAVWTWVINRMESLSGIAAALGIFVLLTFAAQSLIQQGRIQSEAVVFFLLSMPLAYVMALAIVIWGSTPLQTRSTDGE
jgi:hypothetical protein